MVQCDPTVIRETVGPLLDQTRSILLLILMMWAIIFWRILAWQSRALGKGIDEIKHKLGIDKE